MALLSESSVWEGQICDSFLKLAVYERDCFKLAALAYPTFRASMYRIPTISWDISSQIKSLPIFERMKEHEFPKLTSIAGKFIVRTGLHKNPLFFDPHDQINQIIVHESGQKYNVDALSITAAQLARCEPNPAAIIARARFDHCSALNARLVPKGVPEVKSNCQLLRYRPEFETLYQILKIEQIEFGTYLSSVLVPYLYLEPDHKKEEALAYLAKHWAEFGPNASPEDKEILSTLEAVRVQPGS